MPVYKAIAGVGAGLLSFLLGDKQQESNEKLAEQTLQFGKSQQAQEQQQFLITQNILEEELGLKAETLAFQKDKAEKDRFEHQKDRKFAKRKTGAETVLNLFGAQTGLQDRMLSMWNNTGFFGGGAAGTPPANAPAGGGVFSGTN